MTDESNAIHLHRIDPSRNMARFYVLSVQPTLFGGSSIVREWGRIGTRGRCKVDLVDNVEQARQIKGQIERSKLRKGYVDVRLPVVEESGPAICGPDGGFNWQPVSR